MALVRGRDPPAGAITTQILYFPTITVDTGLLILLFFDLNYTYNFTPAFFQGNLDLKHVV